MGWGTGNLGGGSGGLNFKIVGGTSTPSSPKENTIWVDTDVPITSWIFSAKEPSPTEAGMVWISVGSSSSVEFNALKKNAIQVYPISAKQYVSGAWADVTAKSYQNGKWVEWLYIMMRDGEYVRTSIFDVQSVGADQGTLADGSGRLFVRPYANYSALVLRSKDKIPQNVNKLKVSGRLDAGKGSYHVIYLSYVDTWPESFENQIATINMTETSENIDYVFEDLRSVTQDAYLWFASALGGNTASRIVIDDIVEVV